MLPKQLIILGGGASIKEGIEKGLFNLLPNVFSCGLNYAYKYVTTTVNMGVDEKFLNDNAKDLDKLPLYIGKENQALQYRGKNMFFLPPSKNYNPDLIPGVYSSTLVGLFALSLFIKLMEEGSVIYLLGYDYGNIKGTDGKPLTDEKGRLLTHFYQGEVEHRGIGKTSWYNSTLLDHTVTGKRITNAVKEFRPYATQTKVKIFNVSPQSAIQTFPKISYEDFFRDVSTELQNQEDIRKELRKSICGLVNMYVTLKTNPNAFNVPPNLNIQNKLGPFERK